MVKFIKLVDVNNKVEYVNTELMASWSVADAYLNIEYNLKKWCKSSNVYRFIDIDYELVKNQEALKQLYKLAGEEFGD